ncbi:DUF489 family protein [Thioclava electrotropha]|uniref:DUF489 family protein n=1 Tax=Thioclava electrotropha TaxID=1549850 RepID=UPI0034DF5D66
MFVQKDFAGHAPAVRYAVELLGRERPFARDGQRMAHIREALEQISNRYGLAEDDAIFDAGCIDAIAGVFEQTLSRDGGRIQVIGAREHLQREANVARVRALLLAGFRSAEASSPPTDEQLVAALMTPSVAANTRKVTHWMRSGADTMKEVNAEVNFAMWRKKPISLSVCPWNFLRNCVCPSLHT